jgi:hypothetical protein
MSTQVKSHSTLTSSEIIEQQQKEIAKREKLLKYIIKLIDNANLQVLDPSTLEVPDLQVAARLLTLDAGITGVYMYAEQVL